MSLRRLSNGLGVSYRNTNANSFVVTLCVHLSTVCLHARTMQELLQKASTAPHHHKSIWTTALCLHQPCSLLHVPDNSFCLHRNGIAHSCAFQEMKLELVAQGAVGHSLEQFVDKPANSAKLCVQHIVTRLKEAVPLNIPRKSTVNSILMEPSRSHWSFSTPTAFRISLIGAEATVGLARFLAHRCLMEPRFNLLNWANPFC